MKRFLTAALSICLLLVPLAAVVHSQESPSRSRPPVEQPLVREGDFALDLASSLKLGTPENEAEAESLLTSTGIQPRNGWISDYPVTPDILLEIERSTAEAAKSGTLQMSEQQAVRIVRDTSADFGLPVAAAGDGNADAPPEGYDDQYARSGEVDDYYYDYGPPIVTYYPPPWGYSYLYSWVPYPFWWGHFGFTGFFVLRDFHRAVVFRNVNRINVNRLNVNRLNANRLTARRVVTNQVRNPATRSINRIDPVTRTARADVRARALDRNERVNRLTGEDRRAATSILGRNVERRGSDGLRLADARGGGLGPENRLSSRADAPRDLDRGALGRDLRDRDRGTLDNGRGDNDRVTMNRPDTRADNEKSLSRGSGTGGSGRQGGVTGSRGSSSRPGASSRSFSRPSSPMGGGSRIQPGRSFSSPGAGARGFSGSRSFSGGGSFSGGRSFGGSRSFSSGRGGGGGMGGGSGRGGRR